jgi:hypothetical protein
VGLVLYQGPVAGRQKLSLGRALPGYFFGPIFIWHSRTTGGAHDAYRNAAGLNAIGAGRNRRMDQDQALRFFIAACKSERTSSTPLRSAWFRSNGSIRPGSRLNCESRISGFQQEESTTRQNRGVERGEALDGFYDNLGLRVGSTPAACCCCGVTEAPGRSKYFFSRSPRERGVDSK